MNPEKRRARAKARAKTMNLERKRTRVIKPDGTKGALREGVPFERSYRPPTRDAWIRLVGSLQVAKETNHALQVQLQERTQQWELAWLEMRGALQKIATALAQDDILIGPLLSDVRDVLDKVPAPPSATTVCPLELPTTDLKAAIMRGFGEQLEKPVIRLDDIDPEQQLVRGDISRNVDTLEVV